MGRKYWALHAMAGDGVGRHCVQEKWYHIERLPGGMTFSEEKQKDLVSGFLPKEGK